jgi:hypothetical protein
MSMAMTLLALPLATACATSRSRAVSVSRALWAARACASCVASRTLRATARVTASNNTWSLQGFSKKSLAPAFIACTAIGRSPWPLRKITGSLMPRCCSSGCSSSPLIKGMRTSSSRQPGTWPV